MLATAASLLELGVTRERPLMILSGNSLAQIVLIAACEYVGIPTAPVSPSYSLLSSEFTRLLGIHALLAPGAVFVESGPQFAMALQALGTPAAQVIAVHGAAGGQRDWRSIQEAPLTPERLVRVEAARAAIDPARDIDRKSVV